MVDQNPLFDDVLIRMVHSNFTYIMYSTTYILTGYNHEAYFEMLFKTLAQRIRSAEYYVEAAMKKFSLDQEEVIPFVNFFIRYCSSTSGKDWFERIKITKAKRDKVMAR